MERSAIIALLTQGLLDRYALLSGAHRPTMEEATADKHHASELQPYREAIAEVTAEVALLRAEKPEAPSCSTCATKHCGSCGAHSNHQPTPKPESSAMNDVGRRAAYGSTAEPHTVPKPEGRSCEKVPCGWCANSSYRKKGPNIMREPCFSCVEDGKWSAFKFQPAASDGKEEAHA